MTPETLGIGLLHGDDFLDVFDVRRRARRVPAEFRFARWPDVPPRWPDSRATAGLWGRGRKRGQIAACSCIRATALARLADLDLRDLSAMSEAETLTLLRTLPTLCRTLVATSAMPARREASTNC